MKKVGIMTMHRVKNYGSVLQAYALKSVLETLGCDVCFVDFHKDKQNKPRPSITFKDRIKYFASQVINNGGIKKGKLRIFANAVACQHLNDVRFEFEIFESVGISKKENYDSNLDILIIGSDEVFNVKQNMEAGYSLELLGKNHSAKRLISFAGSFGFTSYEDIINSPYVETIKSLFCDFDALSVRDRNSLVILEKLVQKKSQYHLDPVFHYDFKEELPEIKRHKKYVAVYAYSNLEKKIKKAIEFFAEKNNLDILCFSGYQGEMGIFMDVNPFTMLAYIKNADYVITSTFHGCVFSIKFKKKFATIVRNYGLNEYSNEFKVVDLLSRFNLENRIFSGSNKSLDDILHENIDAKSIDMYIMDMVASGIEYLKDNISDKEG